MSDLTTPDRLSTESPFDAIKLTRSDGTEFWSARALMPLLGYEKWERFEDAIERAIITARNSGQEGTFSRVREEGTGGRPREDFHLSRFASYLVAMNGDPRKPEVAAAQSYFAIRTREAETAPALTGKQLLAAAILEAAETIKEQDAKIAELEPKAEFYDELMESDGTYSMLAASKMLGWGRNVMMRDLRRMGVIQGNNLPYQRHEHHFKVVPGTYVNQKTGETVPTATTFVRPAGLEFLRKKLNQAPAVVEAVAS